MLFSFGQPSKGSLSYNKSYEPNGRKAYARAALRYNISPSIEGPLCAVRKVEQAGKFGPGKLVGGRVRVHGHVLAMKDGSGQTRDVLARDVEQKALYLATVGIGTPAQTLTLDFDTGSADIWLWSAELPSFPTPSSFAKDHTIFDPSKSMTFKKVEDSTCKIFLADCSVARAYIGTDTLVLGGMSVMDQSIKLASKSSAPPVEIRGDGVLGLAFGSINTVQHTPVATPDKKVSADLDIPKDAQLFTAYLTKESGDSFYTFNYIEQDVLSGQTPSYTPIDNSKGLWMFASASASINGRVIQLSGNTAIVDTGTTLALVDDAVLEKIYAAIPGAKQSTQQQGWIYPKDTPTESLPTVSFAVGDELYDVKKEDFAFQDLNDGTIYGGIQSRGSQQDFDILGDVFLRAIYAIFDQGNTRFGAVQQLPATGVGGDTKNELSSPPERLIELTALTVVALAIMLPT